MAEPLAGRRPSSLFVRIFAGIGVLAVLGSALLWVERRHVAEWCLRQALRGSGATDVSLKVTRLGWHEAVVSPLTLDAGKWRLSSEQLTLRRDALLGALGVDGRVSLEMGAKHAAVALTFTSTQPVAGRIDTVATATGPGLSAKVASSYFYRDGRSSIKIIEAKVEGDRWQDVAKPWLPAPLAASDIRGQIALEGEGTLENGRFTGRVSVHVRGASFEDTQRHIAARKIAADLVLPSLPALESPPGQTITVGEATVGGVALADARILFQVAAPTEIRISQAGVSAFGGSLSASPFSFDPAAASYASTLKGNDLRIDQILALFPQSQATATGRMELELPVAYDASGLHFGRGWLQVASGQPATVVFHWPGLLTRAVAKGSPLFESLRKIETGEAPMQVSTFHADVFPVHGPEDRSVAIKLVGRPAGTTSMLGDVDLDLNVNGPLESLMNLGLQGNVSTSFGK